MVGADTVAALHIDGELRLVADFDRAFHKAADMAVQRARAFL